jgi:putative SOS response-associated peptidase YedK
MCGRFLNRTPASETARIFGTKNAVPNWPPRYNLAPTDGALAVRFNPETRERSLDVLRWGLIPFWSKDKKIGYSLINARAEGIDTKPSFREAFEQRRCLIPADGFYEWKKLDAKTKQPYAIMPIGEEPFAFAGLWERWKDPASGEIVRSCSIVTGEPNELVAPIHNRMPVILDRATRSAWLGETPAERAELMVLLRPFPAERMRAYTIGPRVGNVRNDDPSLIEAAG